MSRLEEPKPYDASVRREDECCTLKVVSCAYEPGPGSSEESERLRSRRV